MSLRSTRSSLATTDQSLTIKQLKISRRHMGTIFKANLGPRRPIGWGGLKTELISVSYT